MSNLINYKIIFILYLELDEEFLQKYEDHRCVYISFMKNISDIFLFFLIPILLLYDYEIDKKISNHLSLYTIYI